MQEPKWWEETSLMQRSRWRTFQPEEATEGTEVGTIEFRKVEREPECLQSGEWMKKGMRWERDGYKGRHGKEYGFFLLSKHINEYDSLTGRLCLV